MAPARQLKKQQAFKRGLKAEQLAADYLVTIGYKVLAKRYKTNGGEIDLVIKAGAENLVVFVEVKQRFDQINAAYAIDNLKIKRISTAAMGWLEHNPEFYDFAFRFDVITFDHLFRMKHYEHAFEFMDQ